MVKGTPRFYEVTAITSHIGNQVKFGHFKTFVRTDTDWFTLDDSSPISKTSKEELLLGQMFFYKLI